MSALGAFGVALAVVLVINLLPAFGPPTWIVLVYFRVRHDVAFIPLVTGGALAAASGRYLLARAARRLGRRLPPERLEDLQALGERITGGTGVRRGAMALFLLSPLPSTQLFEAAGLTPGVRLEPLTLAFFCGRLVTYAIYVSGASLAAGTLRALLDDGLTSPAAIGGQVASLLLLVVLVITPWRRVLGTREDRAQSRRPPRL